MKYMKQTLAGKTIDIHTHSTGIVMDRLIRGKYPVTQDIVDLSETVERNHIDYAVTFPMPATVYYDAMKARNDHVFVSSGIGDYPYQYENQSLVMLKDQLQLHNLLPFLSFSVHEKIEEQQNNIRFLNQKYGIYGLKYHCTMEQQSIDCEAFEMFAALAEELDIPIMLHSELVPAAHPDRVLRFAMDHPKIRVCVAHAARMYFPFLKKLQSTDIPNLFVDTAPFLRICHELSKHRSSNIAELPYEEPISALRSLFEISPDRLLWGTDIPWHRFLRDDGKCTSYEQEVEVLNASGFKEHLSHNALRYLFG